MGDPSSDCSCQPLNQLPKRLDPEVWSYNFGTSLENGGFIRINPLGHSVSLPELRVRVEQRAPASEP